MDREIATLFVFAQETLGSVIAVDDDVGAVDDDVRMKRVTLRDLEWSAFTDRMAIEGRALESVHAEMRADLSRIFMMLCEIWAKLETLQKQRSGAVRPTNTGV